MDKHRLLDWAVPFLHSTYSASKIPFDVERSAYAFHVFSLTDDATDSGKNSGNVPRREVAGSRMHVFRLNIVGQGWMVHGCIKNLYKSMHLCMRKPEGMFDSMP